MQDIGKNIRYLRQRQGLTQDALAEALFVTRQTVSNYENGVSRPDVEMLIKLAEALGTDANTVLYGPPEQQQMLARRRRLLWEGGLLAVLAAAYLLLRPWALQLQQHRFLLTLYLLKVGLLPLLWLWGGRVLMLALQLFAGLTPLTKPRLRRALLGVLAVAALLVLPLLLFYTVGILLSLNQSSVSLSFPHIPLYSQLAWAAFGLSYHWPFLYALPGMGLWLCGGKEEK